jgi:hypothetical protein
MAVYQPFQGYLSGYQTATQNAMREVWDPVVLDTAFRNSEITRFFQVTNTPWQKGKKLHIRVEDAMLNTARWFGTPFTETSGVGVTLPNPAMTPTWAEWQIAHTDLMGLACSIRYAFPTDEVMNSGDIGSLAEYLSKNSINNMMEGMERQLITGQNASIGVVKKIAAPLQAYASASYVTGSSYCRLWLNRGAPLLHPGDVIDLYLSPSGSSMKLSVTVKNMGTENPAAGVFGYIDVQADSTTKGGGNTSSSFNSIRTSANLGSSVHVFLSGEYSSSATPTSAPAATSGVKAMYGIQDWLKAETGTSGRAVGTLYNINRATLGNQWAVPIVLDKYDATNKTDVAVSMDHIDQLLIQINDKKLDAPNLTNLVLLASPQMTLKLTQLTSSANRRVDGPTAAIQTITTNYGFDGILIHHPSLGHPVAIQQVRGMPDNLIAVLQPGVCEIVQPGGIQWMDWGNGQTWKNEEYSDGNQGGLSRSMVYRADRIAFANSVVRAPRLGLAGLLGVRPA